MPKKRPVSWRARANPPLPQTVRSSASTPARSSSCQLRPPLRYDFGTNHRSDGNTDKLARHTVGGGGKKGISSMRALELSICCDLKTSFYTANSELARGCRSSKAFFSQLRPCRGFALQGGKHSSLPAFEASMKRTQI